MMTAVLTQPVRLLRNPATGVVARLAILALVMWSAAATPGFLSVGGLAATADFAALTGMVALGMSFITISGNILSLSLGATMATSAMIFLAGLHFGMAAALLMTFAGGTAIAAIQGAVIGGFRANPIVISIAGLALITGLVTQITGGAGIYPPESADISFLRLRLGPVSMNVVIFLSAAVLCQLVLSFTRFGRELYLTGSNRNAARVAGLAAATVVTKAYAIAGLLAAVGGIMVAGRFQTASLGIGEGYDYDAIGAVLIGGIAIHGGRGSPFQAVAGALVLSAIQTVLVLRGLSVEYQHLFTGLLVFAAIILNIKARGN